MTAPTTPATQFTTVIVPDLLFRHYKLSEAEAHSRLLDLRDALLGRRGRGGLFARRDVTVWPSYEPERPTEHCNPAAFLLCSNPYMLAHDAGLRYYDWVSSAPPRVTRAHKEFLGWWEKCETARAILAVSLEQHQATTSIEAALSYSQVAKGVGTVRVPGHDHLVLRYDGACLRVYYLDATAPDSLLNCEMPRRALVYRFYGDEEAAAQFLAQRLREIA